MKAVSLMVVDDHPFHRMGIMALIGTRDDMVVAAEASTGEEAVRLFEVHRPDVTLMDLRLPGMSGVDAIRKCRQIAPESRFIAMTMYEGDESIHQAVEAGARGYLIKGMPSEMLLNAIRRVHSGGRFLPPSVVRALQSRTPDAELSARQREVLALLAVGKSNHEIAASLSISEETVKVHVSVILMRLGVRDRTQAVLAALRRGFASL
jgi:DNA-binding NarL/FixJ family response regulator